MLSTKPILFVSHEATRTGAPMMLLHLVRWLRTHTQQEFGILLGRGGALEDDFAQLGTIYRPDDFARSPGLFGQFGLIYSNTICNGVLLESLPYGDIPIVTHVHELDFGFDTTGARNIASVIKHTSHFIVCARIVGDRLHERFRIPREQISVHYECIPFAQVTARADVLEAPALREQYDLPEDAFVVAACGTINVRKAPDLFVQLAARLRHDASLARPWRFLWIGKNNVPELHRALQHDIRRLGLQKEVTFVDELDCPHSLLALADVFCVTSREDPFPLVMLESAALGKPVLCFEGAGGGGEFCAAGGGLAVPFLDVEAMAQQCRELMRREAWRAALGRRAAELVRTRFDVDVIVPELWRELESFVRRPLPISVHRARRSDLVDIFSEWSMDDAPDQPFIRARIALRKTVDAVRAHVAAGRRDEVVPLVVGELHAFVKADRPDALTEALDAIGDAFVPPDVDRTGLPARDDFDEESYLEFRPEIAAAVRDGFFASGWQHFEQHGHRDGWRWVRRERAGLERAAACLLAGGSETDAARALRNALAPGDENRPADAVSQSSLAQRHVDVPRAAPAHLLISELGDARRSRGRADQIAVWDATIDGRCARAIFMHPPAELNFTLPTGARGTLATAVAIHPDAWDKPNGGPCEFHVRVASRVVLVVALNPAHLPGDRHWHELELAIPEDANGCHEVVFETRSIGGAHEHDWALWREPEFTTAAVA